MRMLRGTEKSLLGCALVIPVAVMGVIIHALYSASSGQPALTPETFAIERLVVRAEAAKETLYLAPNTAPGVAFAASEVRKADARADAELGALYSPGSSLLTSETQMVAQWMAAQANGGNKLIAGGIRDVTFGAVAITGAVATVHLTYTNYAVYAVRQPNRPIVTLTPSNQIIADLTLNKTDRGWRITGDSWRFVPGSEP